MRIKERLGHYEPSDRLDHQADRESWEELLEYDKPRKTQPKVRKPVTVINWFANDKEDNDDISSDSQEEEKDQFKEINRKERNRQRQKKERLRRNNLRRNSQIKCSIS